MRLFYDNWIDYAATIITPATQDPILTAANIANELRKRVYRTLATQAAETITLDLGSAKDVTSVILLDHTLTAGDTLIKLQGNATDSWGSPSFSQTLTWAAGTISQVFSTQTFRYWRIIFTKSSAGVTRDIGRVFLGTYYETTEAPDYAGLNWGTVDPSKGTKTPGGITYYDVKEKFDEFSLKFSDYSQTDITNFETIFALVGQTISFFVQIDPNNAPADRFYYVKITEDFKRNVTAFSGTYFWDTAMKLEEQL